MSAVVAGARRAIAPQAQNGIDVRLLWDPRTNHVTVAVQDERSDESFEPAVEVADALAAFHHPRLRRGLTPQPDPAA